MFYMYLYILIVPKGTIVYDSDNHICIVTEDLSALYMDVEQCDRDTMGNISNELYYILYDNHMKMRYPMIESLYNAKIRGGNSTLSVCNTETIDDISSIFAEIKNKERIIIDGVFSALVHESYIVPHVYDPCEKYPLIDISGWRTRIGSEYMIDVDTSSDEDISSDISI